MFGIGRYLFLAPVLYLFVFGWSAVLLVSPAGAALKDVDCGVDESVVCRVTTTDLELRLLVKPQSNIYVEMNEASAQLSQKPDSFDALYAFEAIDVSYDDNTTASGWFRVGFNKTTPEGYMRAEDVVPWKQALALAYTNPGPSERKGVVMFKDEAALDNVLASFIEGTETPQGMYEKLLSGDVPPGIVSRENPGWVNIEQNFYLMPILDVKNLNDMRTDGDLQAVQLAALTNQPRSKQAKACNLQTAGSDQCQSQDSVNFSSDLALDAVFVIDMTYSMQPYIDAVRDSIREAAQLLESNFSSSSGKLRLGLVGYRDDPSATPGIEFSQENPQPAHNFTPGLLEAPAFRDLLESGIVTASDVGSGDYAEDVFSGLRMAIESNWSPSAARLIILIGDASGHPVGDPKNATGMSEASLKEMADEQGVSIASIYINSTPSDLAAARPQFETVASGSDEGAATFAIVESSGGASESGSALEVSLRNSIGNVLEFIRTGKFSSIMSNNTSADDSASQAMMGAVRAAFVEYIGSESSPPPNIVAWALDRDPTDYKKKAFDIKVMIQRKGLQELHALLTGILSSFQSGKTKARTFFDTVQKGSTATSYDLEIEDDKAIGTSKQVPKWISELPYQSKVLSTSLEEFRQMPPADRQLFEDRLGKLIELYDDVMNRADKWVPLNKEGSLEEQVYMLDLNNLP